MWRRPRLPAASSSAAVTSSASVAIGTPGGPLSISSYDRANASLPHPALPAGRATIGPKHGAAVDDPFRTSAVGGLGREEDHKGRDLARPPHGRERRMVVRLALDIRFAIFLPGGSARS